MATEFAPTASMFLVMLLACLPMSMFFLSFNRFVATSFGVVPHITPTRWLSSVFIPVLVAYWGLRRKSLSLSGAITGLLVGFVLTISSYTFVISILMFFASSSKITKFNKRMKEVIESDYELHSKRNWVQVVSNGLVACILSVFYVLDCGSGEQVIDMVKHYRCSWIAIGVLGAISCCNGDTWASEIGSVVGKADPMLITSWKTVPRGTNGGVSICGLLVSFVGGMAVGLGYYIALLLFIPPNVLEYAPPQWPIVLVGAFGGLIGSLIDSLLGATLQFSGLNKKGQVVNCPGEDVIHICGSHILDNNSVNLLSSLLTAVVLPYVALSIM